MNENNVTKGTLILSTLLTGCATLIVTAVVMWFAVTNINNSARADVIKDMELVSKTAQQK